MDNFRFRKMLVNIQSGLSTTELETLKFAAGIKRNLAETIQQATDLFQILEERGDLKPNDLNKFRELIGVLDTRKDLLQIIDDYLRDDKVVDGDNVECLNHYSGVKYPIMSILKAAVLADGDLKLMEDILENHRDVIERIVEKEKINFAKTQKLQGVIKRSDNDT